MKSLLSTVILFGAFGTMVGFAKAQELKLENCPVAVQQAIKDNSNDITLVGIASDIENGKTEYKAETKADGHTKSIIFDEKGKLVSVEDEVKMDSIPVSVKAAIERKAKGGKIVQVEKITKDNKVFYEAALMKNGNKSEPRFTDDGSPAGEN